MPDNGVTTWQAADLLEIPLSQKQLQAVLRISDWILTGARALDAYPNAIWPGCANGSIRRASRSIGLPASSNCATPKPLPSPVSGRRGRT